MQRIKDEFLNSIENVFPLRGLTLLEIGCGDGTRSADIASRCKSLTSIEPDESKLTQALARKIPHVTFKIGSGERLLFSNASFDVVVFTLSFHHIPIEKMETAIDEAVRVTRISGHIIFLEPTEDGTFFDSEIQFDACDGDERIEKAAAYKAMTCHKKLRVVQEIDDETIFRFDSPDDFIKSMSPKKNSDEIKDFLKRNDYILRAGRRISIFQPFP